VDKDGRQRVLVAVEQRLREVVVGVDAGGQHHVETAPLGYAPGERGIAKEEHRARLDHRLYPVALDRVGVRDRGLPLGNGVVEVRELKANGLVDRAEVLVDERSAELFDIDRSAGGLDGRHLP
jgi:hypothetical protein